MKDEKCRCEGRKVRSEKCWVESGKWKVESEGKCGKRKNISALVAKINSEDIFCKNLRPDSSGVGNKIQGTRKLMFKTGQH